MLLDLATEIPRGGKWLSEFPVARGTVLYIDEESSPGLLRMRLRKLLSHKGLLSTNPEIHFLVGKNFSFNNPGHVDSLRRLMKEIRPSIVIVDSLIRVHQFDENRASEMARLFGLIKQLVREFKCCFVFADHQRKPGRFRESGGVALRGTTEKVAFVDSLLSVSKTSGGLKVEHSKSRFAQEQPAFIVRIEDPSSGCTSVLYCGEAEAAENKDRLEEARNIILEQLNQGEWVSRKELLSAVGQAGISHRRFGETIKALCAGDGPLESEKRSTGSRGGPQAFYRLKDGVPE